MKTFLILYYNDATRSWAYNFVKELVPGYKQIIDTRSRIECYGETARAIAISVHNATGVRGYKADVLYVPQGYRVRGSSWWDYWNDLLSVVRWDEEKIIHYDLSDFDMICDTKENIMHRIIDDRSTGKTRQLLQYAHDNNYVVLCARPDRMIQKALAYGLSGLTCVAYTTNLNDIPGPYVIDELEDFMEYCMSAGETSCKGYTMTVEE